MQDSQAGPRVGVPDAGCAIRAGRGQAGSRMAEPYTGHSPGVASQGVCHAVLRVAKVTPFVIVRGLRLWRGWCGRHARRTVHVSGLVRRWGGGVHHARASSRSHATQGKYRTIKTCTMRRKPDASVMAWLCMPCMGAPGPAIAPGKLLGDVWFQNRQSPTHGRNRIAMARLAATADARIRREVTVSVAGCRAWCPFFVLCSVGGGRVLADRSTLLGLGTGPPAHAHGPSCQPAACMVLCGNWVCWTL